MKSEICYEWTLEKLDENKDIVDSDFSEKLNFGQDCLIGSDLGLLRRVGSNDAGEIDRVWAYVKDGKLPEYFSDAMGTETSIRVPKRFIVELKKYFKN